MQPPRKIFLFISIVSTISADVNTKSGDFSHLRIVFHLQADEDSCIDHKQILSDAYSDEKLWAVTTKLVAVQGFEPRTLRI
jgi:hypothetical protein